MAIWPWYGVLTTGGVYSGEGYNAAEFLDAQGYRNVVRWTEEIAARPAVRRGRMVNRLSGPLEGQLRERHDASDFETRTQDKLEAAEARPG
jgi:GST-like protein